MLSNKTILVLSPHADDAELGVGGTIARAVAEGSRVVVVLATVGDIKFHHLGRIASEEERLQEFNASMSVLGVQHTEVLSRGYDSTLNTYPMGKMVAQMDELQEKYKPDIVMLPLSSFHQDHRYCWEIGVASTRPSPHKHTPWIICAYEYPLSSWGEGSSANNYKGGMYVDVTGNWETKIKALQCYQSQMRGDLAQISAGGAVSLARMRGMEIGVQFAEVLYVLRIHV